MRPLGLVLAGGYDTRLLENREVLAELQTLARDLGVQDHVRALVAAIWRGLCSYHGDRHLSTSCQAQSCLSCKVEASRHGLRWEACTWAQVMFLPSFTDQQREELLQACRAVVYTPANEHFGIVPLEAMAAGRPVIAVNSGGPLETVKPQSTGLLCEPQPEAFARAMMTLAVSPALSWGITALQAEGTRYHATLPGEGG